METSLSGKEVLIHTSSTRLVKGECSFVGSLRTNLFLEPAYQLVWILLSRWRTVRIVQGPSLEIDSSLIQPKFLSIMLGETSMRFYLFYTSSRMMLCGWAFRKQPRELICRDWELLWRECLNQGFPFSARHWRYSLYRDNVEWDSEQEKAAQQKIDENSCIKLGEDEQGTSC